MADKASFPESIGVKHVESTDDQFIDSVNRSSPILERLRPNFGQQKPRGNSHSASSSFCSSSSQSQYIHHSDIDGNGLSDCDQSPPSGRKEFKVKHKESSFITPQVSKSLTITPRLDKLEETDSSVNSSEYCRDYSNAQNESLMALAQGIDAGNNKRNKVDDRQLSVSMSEYDILDFVRPSAENDSNLLPKHTRPITNLVKPIVPPRPRFLSFFKPSTTGTSMAVSSSLSTSTDIQISVNKSSDCDDNTDNMFLSTTPDQGGTSNSSLSSIHSLDYPVSDKVKSYDDNSDVYLLMSTPDPISNVGRALSSLQEGSQRFIPTKTNSVESLNSSKDDIYVPLDTLYLSDSEQPDWDTSLSEAKSGVPAYTTEFKIAEEIAASENRYLVVLEILQDAHARLSSIFTLNPDRLEQVNRVFKEIPSLSLFHKFFAEQLNDCMKAGNHLTMSTIFLLPINFSQFKMYKPFMTNFESNQTILVDLLREEPEADGICQQLQLESEAPGLSIAAHYQSVSTRLIRLILLFDRLQKYLPPSTRPYADAKKTSQMLKVLVQSFETDLGNMEQHSHTRKILSQLEGRINDVMPSTKFVKSGPVTKISKRRGGRILDRQLFLFSDYLVVTECVNAFGRFKVRNEISVHSIKIQELTSEDLMMDLDYCIRINGIEECITLKFQSEEEMREWQNVVQKTVMESLERKSSLASQSEFDFVAPEWDNDRDSCMCRLCGRKFRMMFRRHHCRACGKLVCSKCSMNRAPLPFNDGKVDRVCDRCYDDITSTGRVSVLDCSTETDSEVSEVRRGTLVYQERVGGQSWSSPLSCHCVLDSQSKLAVFERRKDIKSLATIVTLAFNHDTSTAPFTLVLKHPTAQLAYQFKMSSAGNMADWLADINRTIHSFRGESVDTLQ